MAFIRCAIFDFWNVTAIFDTPRFYSFIKDNSKSGEKVVKPFSKSFDGVYKKFDRGDINYDDFFRLISQGANLRPETTIEAFSDMFGKTLCLDSGMLDIQRQLRRRGIATALITNINSFHVDYIWRNYPAIFNGFDFKFISCEEKIAKPNPEAWVRTLDSLGLRAEETLFVDDFIENIGVACNLGIKGWHYDITDEDYFQNGRLEEERKKLMNFLDLLWSRGILKPYC